jgi:hypothetical protein
MFLRSQEQWMDSEFDSRLGAVRVAREDHGSTFLPVDRVWMLRGFPKDRSPRSVLSSEIVSRLPAKVPQLEVVVMNNCNLPALEVRLASGQIEMVTWIDNPGSILEPHPGKPRP